MPEIDIIHVEKWGDGYEATDPVGEVLHASDPDFGLADMAALAEDYGVTRWSEYTGEEGLDLTRVDGSPLPVVLIGWAEAPIARNDVDNHYDHGTSHPAINIKVYDMTLPDGDEFASVVAEHELDPRLKALPLDELRSLIDTYIEKNDISAEIFNQVCADAFDDAKEEVYRLFGDPSLKVYSEGRQGGWLTVHGLPDVGGWGVKLLTAWQQLSEFCAAEVTDIPRRMVWDVLANFQDELAGRVVSVKLTFILCDQDLAELEAEDNLDPKGWDWHAALDFQPETEIRAE